MKHETKNVIKIIDKILVELLLQTNIILDGIKKIYSYIDNIEVHYIMENMFKSSIELSKYLNNILDYKKYILNDEIEVNNSPTNILQIIKHIFSIYNVKMETYNIIFNYNLSNEIRNNLYLIDKKYLTQIIINIIDIIINDIESNLSSINNNKILINIEYNKPNIESISYLEFNIYYTSHTNIDMDKITEYPFDKYNIKYNIINLLIKHLKGDIQYYNKLDESIGYDKQITIRLPIKNTDKKDITSLSYSKNTPKKSIVILSSNGLYINIIISALEYYKDIIELEIIPLTNIKSGFDYINENNNKINFIILDIEYNNLLGLNILNNLYKYKDMKFILTTSIATDNIKNYIGKEYENNRIFIYIKPINNHNIKKIKSFLLNDCSNEIDVCSS
jgi:hypothetical protein